MTKSLIEALNLPSMEDVLLETGDVTSADFEDNLDKAGQAMAMVDGRDHAQSMDEIHGEAMRHAKDLAELGFQMDHARARGIFEQSANFFKIAADVKTAKRDAQLKAMKLALEEKKLEMARSSETPGSQDIDVVLTGDRNEILAKLRGPK